MLCQTHHPCSLSLRRLGTPAPAARLHAQHSRTRLQHGAINQRQVGQLQWVQLRMQARLGRQRPDVQHVAAACRPNGVAAGGNGDTDNGIDGGLVEQHGGRLQPAAPAGSTGSSSAVAAAGSGGDVGNGKGVAEQQQEAQTGSGGAITQLLSTVLIPKQHDSHAQPATAANTLGAAAHAGISGRGTKNGAQQQRGVQGVSNGAITQMLSEVLTQHLHQNTPVSCAGVTGSGLLDRTWAMMWCCVL